MAECLTGFFGCAGRYTGHRHYHNADTVPCVDCILHHSPVLAAALHLGWARNHTQNGLQDWLLRLLSGCSCCYHSAVASLPSSGMLVHLCVFVHAVLLSVQLLPELSCFAVSLSLCKLSMSDSLSKQDRLSGKLRRRCDELAEQCTVVLNQLADNPPCL